MEMACSKPYLTKSGYVPCGKCPQCVELRASQWVFRLQQEQKNHDHYHFVTFTYETTFVPISDTLELTLQKKDLQDFFKRLRFALGSAGSRIKYYAVGEYGSSKNRPHYHAIIFGVSDPSLYQSIWGLKKNGMPFGNVLVGDVNGSSIGYTCGYIQKGRIPKHLLNGRAPEFNLMSKGLGQSYCQDPRMIMYHLDDPTRRYVNADNQRKLTMPRYYRERIYEYYASQETLDYAAEQLIQFSQDAEMRRSNDYFTIYPHHSELDYAKHKLEASQASFDNFRKGAKTLKL